MLKLFCFFFPVTLIILPYHTQILFDDFETNPPSLNWTPDDCLLDTYYDNPYVTSQNESDKVLRYHDVGGLYANINFTFPYGIDFSQSEVFSLKIYVPSSALTGNENNQVSLKLQNSILDQPWTTQSEIIKNIELDVWQEVTFDFANDNFINYNQNSAPPIQRQDFNRVVIQVNGENNTSQVLAYIDDFFFDGVEIPIFDALVWNDEFDVSGQVNSEKWFHQTILPNGTSWFNDEIQHYTNRIENSSVEDGKLRITAIRENFTDQGVTKEFTSARLNSKFAFTYGKVEVRAKLPSGIGTWPAIWTLGKNISELGAYWQTQGFGTTSWPACGEIDIMEHWGWNQNFVQSAIHTPSSHGATVNHGGQVIETVSSDFHTYTMYWYPNKFVFLVDNQMHYVYQPSVQDAATWPFDADQFLLLNFAIEPSIEASFNQGSMEIDFVRVYQEAQAEDHSSTEFFSDDLNAISVFPNPSENRFEVSVPEQLFNTNIEIFNSIGQSIDTKCINDSITTIDLNKHHDGVYMLLFDDGRTVKIVKNSGF